MTIITWTGVTWTGTLLILMPILAIRPPKTASKALSAMWTRIADPDFLVQFKTFGQRSQRCYLARSGQP